MAPSPAANSLDALGRDLVLRWGDYLDDANDGSIDLGFAKGWLKLESNGDTCSTGGGNLDEIGIAQHNVPQSGPNAGQIVGESGKPLGFSRAELAAACHADGSPPTDDEMKTSAAAAMALMRDCYELASDAVSSTGVAWPVGSTDWWAAVKFPHACGKAGLTELLPAVVEQHGTAISFQEFRDHAMNASGLRVGPGIQALLAASSHRGLRNRLDDCFAGAQECAAFADGTGTGLGGGVVERALGGGLAFVVAWFLGVFFGRKGGAS